MKNKKVFIDKGVLVLAPAATKNISKCDQQKTSQNHSNKKQESSSSSNKMDIDTLDNMEAETRPMVKKEENKMDTEQSTLSTTSKKFGKAMKKGKIKNNKDKKVFSKINVGADKTKLKIIDLDDEDVSGEQNRDDKKVENIEKKTEEPKIIDLDDIITDDEITVTDESKSIEQTTPERDIVTSKT